MRPHPVNAETAQLELAALAALANLAAVDVRGAAAMLDETGVQAQDFADQHHAAVWAVVESMVRDGRQPDFFAVQSKCPGVPRELLTRALMSEDTTAPLERLTLVRNYGQRRRIATALGTVRGLVLDRTRPLEHAVAEAQKALADVSTTGQSSATLDGAVMALCDTLDEIQRGARLPVLPSGIEALDAAIGGLQPTLTIIGSLPAVGKSALLVAIIRNLAARGVKTGFFSLEDEREFVVQRLVAEAAAVPLFVLRNKPLGHHQRTRVAESVEKLHTHLRNVVVDDRPAMTAADVVASARDMITRHGCKALLVDHLGEIRLTRSERHDLDIADALQQLRALAKTYRVPVVVACHLRRREGLSKRDEPRLTDFAFSASIERMARVALGLSRPDDQTLRVHVLKQTNGVAGLAVDLNFTGPAGVVANWASADTLQRLGELYGAQEVADE
jgi:replicative DNA helicase